jgi:hypothetical protein
MRLIKHRVPADDSNSITPALVSILCAVMLFPKEFYCQDCHFTGGQEERAWRVLAPFLS